MGMRFGMKLMGTPKLRDLARCGPDDMSGTVGALCAELSDASWRSPADVSAQFPTARVEGANVRIVLGETQFVDLVVNYRAGIVLVSDAGPRGGRSAIGLRRGNEAA